MFSTCSNQEAMLLDVQRALVASGNSVVPAWAVSFATTVPHVRGKAQRKPGAAGGRQCQHCCCNVPSQAAPQIRQPALSHPHCGLWPWKPNWLLGCCENQPGHSGGWCEATESCSVMGDGDGTRGEERVMLLPGEGVRAVLEGKLFYTASLLCYSNLP